MKLRDIHPPLTFYLYASMSGMRIAIPGKVEFDKLMQHLENLGWNWLGGTLPTRMPFSDRFKSIYLCTSPAFITDGSYYNDICVFEIEDWDWCIEHTKPCYCYSEPSKQLNTGFLKYFACSKCEK